MVSSTAVIRASNKSFSRIFDWLIWLIPFALYLYRTFLLSRWIIDDAAISFAYSRNLADGYGLVTQPGMPPVEGFSNFLWVVLLAPFFKLGLFDPYWLPKLLSGMLVAGAFFLTHRTIMLLTDENRAASFFTLLVLSVNASFAVWTCSGLENGLLVFLVAWYMYVIAVWSFQMSDSPVTPGICALLATAIAMTRPDGLVYAAVFPALAAIVFTVTKPAVVRVVREVVIFGCAFAVLYGSFLLFRYLYFGDLYPNTYYVKGGPDIQTVKDLVAMHDPYPAKLRELLASVFGKFGWTVLAVFMGFQATRLMIRGGRNLRQLIPLILCLASIVAYLLLGPDWMREYRFATPFFLTLTASIFIFLSSVIEGRSVAPLWKATMVTALGLVILITSWRIQTPRLEEFAKWPAVSFERIAREYGTTYDKCAESLGLSSASLLVPDLGGPLYYSKLKVYDLAGLCDRTIARKRGQDQEAFYDYIFEETKPTFIHTHGFFSAVSRFERDERFRRDYVAIFDAWEPYYSDSVLGGDYVRRDAIVGKDSLLAHMRTLLGK